MSSTVEWQREYRKKHPERMRASQRKYYATHREKCIAATKRYIESHRDLLNRKRRKHKEAVIVPAIVIQSLPPKVTEDGSTLLSERTIDTTGL